MTGGEVAKIAYDAGFRGAALVRAVAIAKRESGWQPDAYNGNANTGDNSVGLMQINMIGQLGVNRVQEMNRVLGTNFQSVDEAKQALKDPALNMRYAFYISGGGQDWQPWTTNQGIDYGTDLQDAARVVAGANLPVSGGGRADTTSGIQFNQTAPASGDTSGGSAVPDSTTDPYYQKVLDYLAELDKIRANPPQPDDQGFLDPAAVTKYNNDQSTLLKLIDTYSKLSPTFSAKALPPNQSQQTTTSTFNPNESAQQNFTNAMSRAGLDISYDNSSLSNATEAIDRFLSGQQESRARSQQILDAQNTLIKYGTAPGKSSFSLADLGAGFASRAGDMGIDPNAAFINYSGTINIDPAAVMNQYDRSFGTAGQIPTIPTQIANPANFPQTPYLPNVPTTTTQTTNQSSYYGGGGGSPTIPFGGGGPSSAVDPAGVSGGNVLPPGSLGPGQW